jgi:hypothetical protein
MSAGKGQAASRAVELHWPALVAGAGCVGLGLSNWLSPGMLAPGLFVAGVLGLLGLAGP